MPDSPYERMTRHAWAVLLVLCGTVFLEGLDVSMMGVALPSMRADLALSTSSLQWVVSAYVLGYGGFVLLGGRAADLFGRRRMFLLWLAVFIGFSGLGGLATGGEMLVVARFVTGVSAGFLTPASLSIITTSFGGGDVRNRALLIYGAAGAAGFSLGMVAGGLLTTAGWRWVFFAPVLVASLLLAMALRVLTESPADAAAADARARPSRRQFDLGGALAVTGGMLLLVLGVVRAPEVPGATTAVTLAASAVLLATFVAVERRSPAPLVRLGVLRSGALVRANLGALLFVGSFVAFQFVVVLYLQELRGWSALETGLALLVAGIDAVIAPTLTIAATEGLAEEEQGLAGGLLNASTQFGGALLLAIVAAVNVVVTGDDPTRADLLDGYRAALVVPTLGVLVGAALTAFGLRRKAATTATSIAAPIASPAAPTAVDAA